MHSRSVERQRFANVDILPQTGPLFVKVSFPRLSNCLLKQSNQIPWTWRVPGC